MDQIPKVGAFVLETLTTGMYTNPLDTLREFIQNSADSIHQGEQQGILSKNAGRIQVCLNPKQHTLSIRDNGVGISQVEAYTRLVNIGMSGKRIETDAGFRGIGRLAGIAYCKTLYFRTSMANEGVLTTVEMDCEGLRRFISPAMRQTEELVSIVQRNTRTSSENCQAEDHFFEVVIDYPTRGPTRI
jgi:molecular chaperone HtpG